MAIVLIYIGHLKTFRAAVMLLRTVGYLVWREFLKPKENFQTHYIIR